MSAAPDVLEGQLSFEDALEATELSRARKLVKANEPLYRAFLRLADRLVANGREFYSARSIFEALRWESAVGDLSAEYRINNNLTRPFAVVAMADGRVPKGFFRTRDHKGVRP